jgi:hypothetical protein
MNESDAAKTSKNGVAILSREAADAALQLLVVVFGRSAATAMDSRQDLTVMGSNVSGGAAMSERQSSFSHGMRGRRRMRAKKAEAAACEF